MSRPEHYELRAWDGGDVMAERLATTRAQMMSELTELVCSETHHRVDVMRLRDGVIVLRWERDGRAIVQP